MRWFMEHVVGRKEVEEMAQELESLERAEPEVRTGRPRKATLLKLQWLSERLRRCERIKRELQAGTYHVDSQEVAKSILNLR